MTNFLIRAALTTTALALPFSAALGQAIPAETETAPPGVGFSLPRVGGTLNYGISAGELISNGFYNNSGVNFTTNLSGDLAYVSKSQFHPFSAVYAGGVLLANSGQPNTFYQSLSFSQVLSTKRWNIVASDSVSYLPQSPTIGLSGIPGVGDLGVDPIPVTAAASGLGILTAYGPRVSNSTSLSVSRELTARLSAQASGNFSIQRFIGDNSGEGINSTNEGGSAGLSYKLSARDSLEGDYNYNRFNYTGTPDSFNTQSGILNYSRRWSARLSTFVSGGPQFSSGSGPIFSGSFVSFAGGAGASYLSRTTSYSLNYSRGVNNGSGVLPGSFADSIVLAAHRQFGRDWAGSANVSYSRSTSLPILNFASYKTDGVAFGLQASRGFGRNLSVYAAYTLQDQSTSGSGIGNLAQNAFNGVYQIFSVGLTYSPRSIRLNK